MNLIFRFSGLFAAMTLAPPMAMALNEISPLPAREIKAEVSDLRVELRLTYQGKEWLSEPAWLMHGPGDTVTLVAVGVLSKVMTGERQADGRYRLRLDDGNNSIILDLAPNGGKLVGRWNRGMTSGEAVAVPANAALTTADFASVFEKVTDILDVQFFDPTFNGRNWPELKARYRPRALSAANEGAFVLAVREMLQEIGVSHLGFFSQASAPSSPTAATSDTRQIVTWNSPAPGIAYMRIARFSELPHWRTMMDRGFAELANTQTLILDLRGNGGGNLSLGMRLADHLMPETRSFGIYVSRKGLAIADVPSIDEYPRDQAFVYDGYDQDEFMGALQTRGAVSLESGGRAFTHPRQLYVLIDGLTGSAAEAVAAEFKENGAILVGERTAGAMLVSLRENVAPEWVLRFPAGDFRTGNGVMVEGVGVEPNHLTKSSGAYDLALDMAKRGSE